MPRQSGKTRRRCSAWSFHGEARTPVLDKRDIQAVIGARYALPKGTQFAIKHTKGAEEPLLWVADVLAGAVRAGREGNETYRSILAERIYEIDVDTGC